MPTQPLTIDHLMWGGPDLDATVDALAARTGCRATSGGAHPGNGTRNALLGLGGACYLEVIAPDPAQTSGIGLAAELAALHQPALRAWAVRSQALDRVAAELNALGLKTSAPRAMSRRTATGELLQWQLLFAQDAALAGVLPFFIDWGASTHPTQALSHQCRLDALCITLPPAHGLAGWFSAIPGVRVDAGTQPGVRALLTTPRGQIELV